MSTGALLDKEEQIDETIGSCLDEDHDDPQESLEDNCQELTVRLRYPGRLAQYCHCHEKVKRGDHVIVESERGQCMATVLASKAHCPKSQASDAKSKLSETQRVANNNDQTVHDRNRSREKEAFIFCLQRIKARELPMKLIDVEFIHNGNKAVFYFFSEGRVDFRSLVKDLAQRFHTRIEMRQIGVRDGSKILGGLGICGRQLCCNTWLTCFEPVSIRMAKDQNLSLNPQKVSGLCGRLMCCLVYEQETYKQLRKGLPKIGRVIETPDGEGKVIDVSVLARIVQVSVEGSIKHYGVEEDGRITTVSVKPEKPSEPSIAELQPLNEAEEEDEELQEERSKPAHKSHRRSRASHHRSRSSKRDSSGKDSTEVKNRTQSNSSSAQSSSDKPSSDKPSHDEQRNTRRNRKRPRYRKNKKD